MTTFPQDFLWGASTAPHQIEGNNLASDWWAREQLMPGMERSGDACDSYHRYGEDIGLLAETGLNAYRFGIEWARIEPEAGEFSRAELDHYRRVTDATLAAGLTPVVTLHHFTFPKWFAQTGGFLSDEGVDRFSRYVEQATSILDGVEWVATINEPNMLAMMLGLARAHQQGKAGDWQSPTVDDGPRPQLPAPEAEIGHRMVEVHSAAREIVRARTSAKVGWTVANRAFVARPGGEEKLTEIEHDWENLYLEASRADDWVGVQSYSSQWVTAEGIEPYPPHPDNTLVGTAYRPDALGIAVRHTAEVTGGVPIVVTENGIATSDDTRRIAYTDGALRGLADAMADGIDVRGYLHWSLLDNYEWGHWGPTFGLVEVDRQSFTRTPKPSLRWLGSVARRGAL